MWFPAAVCQKVKVYHPVDPNLGFLHCVMLIDDKDAINNEPVVNVAVSALVSWMGLTEGADK